MKLVRKIMLILSIVSVCIITANYVHGNVKAESYESSVGLSFTLNPTITLTVSGDLSINNLSPGDYKDSNIITVTAESNAVSGYTVSSTVGSSSNASTELRKDGTDTTNKFTNLTTNKASLSAFDENNNTWGYSWCNGTCNAGTDPSLWVSGNVGDTSTGYNGLPLYNSSSSITMVDTTAPGSSTISFKIGARSTTNQIAGEYTNIINFTALAKPNPIVPTLDQVDNMQDFFSCTLTPVGTTNTLTDTRDNKSYTVTKLKDGNCWMTTNLNISGGTALSADDTDVSSDYINSFTTSNNLTKDSTNNKIVLPASSTSGFDTNNYSYVYNSTSTTCATDVPCYGYYSWDAATLGSGRNISTENTDAPYSICPNGWRLPTSGSQENDGWKRGDFYQLAQNYGVNLSSTWYELSTIFYDNAGPSTTPNFLLGGYYNNGSFNGSTNGYYWSSTPYRSSTSARFLYFNTSTIGSANDYLRLNGFSLRCLRSL